MKHKTGKYSLIALIVFLLAGAAYYYMFQYIPKNDILIASEPDSLVIEQEVLRLYGIPVDSFIIETGKVKRNQILLSILSEYNLPDGALAKLITNKYNNFDLRKIKAGNNFSVFLVDDSLYTLRYFIYEHSPIEFVRIYFGDSITVDLEQKEVKQIKKFARGVINSSLWNAMVDRGYNPVLANELSEIYAWSIDFFGLQPADSFAIFYDEQYVDSISVGLGKIYSAYFRHAGTDFYAIPFTQDSIESYYDLDGNSLRKAFLKAPLRFSRISSRYSNSRLHPILKIRRPHHGVDYSAPTGTPVQAIGDGKVIEAKHGYNRGGGNYIKIKHNGTYSTAYLHLSGFARGIGVGKYVKQGDIIGYVGTTGLATGPHLDFRFYKNGAAVDPLKVEAPPVEPVKDENRVSFEATKSVALRILSYNENQRSKNK